MRHDTRVLDALIRPFASRARRVPRVLALISAVAATGCAHDSDRLERRCARAAHTTAHEPRQTRPFSVALRDYRSMLRLLENTAPVARSDVLRATLRELAFAMRHMPGVPEGFRREVAHLVSQRQSDLWLAASRGAPTAQQAHEALAIVSSALRVAASDVYPGNTAVLREADLLARLVGGIDPSAALDDARPAIIAALEQSERALSAIEAADAQVARLGRTG
jgi:hypothetical protein